MDDTGPWRVRAVCQARIRSKDHWYHMILSSDDEWNQNYPLAYLGQLMVTELPLDLSLSNPATKSDPGGTDGGRTATGLWGTKTLPRTRMQRRQIDAELTLGLSVLETLLNLDLGQ
ncbi:hypothetical protein NN561_017553 [Cricetulus griseus]